MSETGVLPGFRSAGQAVARSIALRSLSGGRLPGTLLVHGPPGAGKDSFVDDLLALLLCEVAPAERPCNACRGCRQARARSHPDLVIGSPEVWRDHRSTGESITSAARRWLADASGAPIAGERRIVLIEGLDRAGEPMQNVLLKALEEPTARHLHLLVADWANRVLPTIRSRSQLLRVGAVPRAELINWLVDHERLPIDQAEDLARAAGGLAGTASSYARDPRLIDWQRRTQLELLALLERGRADRFGSVRDLLDEAGRLEGSSPSEAAGGSPEALADGEAPRASGAAQRAAALLIVDAWLGLARDLLMIAAGRPRLVVSAHLLAELQPAAEGIEPGSLLRFVGTLARVRDGLGQNGAPRLGLEVAMLAWPSPSAR